MINLIHMSENVECDIAMANLSVRPSVTRWYCIEMIAYIVKLFSPSGSVIISFLQHYCRYKIPRGPLLANALNTT